MFCIIMSASIHNEKDALRDGLVELFDESLFEPTYPDDSPLAEFHRMNSSERSSWFSSLTESDLEYLATYWHVWRELKTKPTTTRPRK